MKSPSETRLHRPPDSIESLAAHLGLDPKELEERARQLLTSNLLLMVAILRPLKVPPPTGGASGSSSKAEPEPVLVKISEAMRILGLSRTKIYELMDKRRLEWCRPDRDRRILMTSVRQLIEKTKESAA